MRGERLAGPTAILAGGRLMQGLEVERAFVRALVGGGEFSLAAIRKAAEGTGKAK